MRTLLINIIFFSLLISTSLFTWNEYQDFKENYSKSAHTQYQKNTNSHSVPVQKQYKGEFNLENGISLSNKFDGARLNGVALTNDSTITVLITPENVPVKPNSWYAFKIWSKKNRKIYIKFTYPQGVEHRYHPKLSKNGINWFNLESDKYFATDKDEKLNRNLGISDATMEVDIGPDTLWIAAHEVITSKDIDKWIKELSAKSYISNTKIGESHEGRPIYAVSIEDDNADKNIVILSRQYATMSAGYIAMKSFIETIIEDSEAAKNFRSEYNIYLFPHINPDGADNGHWGHNAGGVNLSEDWGNSMQPETISIKKFISGLAKETKENFYLNIDFRSNEESILYVFNQDKSNKIQGLTLGLAESVTQYLPDYQPAIKPRTTDNKITKAEDYFYREYGMESLVVIIDEDSKTSLIKQKGEALALTALHLMTNL